MIKGLDRLPYLFPIPRTNSMKQERVFPFTLQLNCGTMSVRWNVLFRSSDVKQFKRNLFDSVMCKLTPDSFKIDGIF